MIQKLPTLQKPYLAPRRHAHSDTHRHTDTLSHFSPWPPRFPFFVIWFSRERCVVKPSQCSSSDPRFSCAPVFSLRFPRLFFAFSCVFLRFLRFVASFLRFFCGFFLSYIIFLRGGPFLFLPGFPFISRFQFVMLFFRMPDTVVVQTVWEFVIDPWRNIWGAGIIFVDSILKKKKYYKLMKNA